VPLTESGGSPDWAREMLALVASHKTLDWLKPTVGSGPHIAVWQDDDGAQRAERDVLRELVLYVRARLGRG
jgi:hypothetical protein